jgi:hypothetical protein
VTLFDVTGSCILREAGNVRSSSTVFDLSDLSAGMYILRVKGSRTTAVQRIVLR